MSPRTAQMALTPKGIRIGIATIPRQRITPTDDAMLIQRALLSKPRSKDWPVGVALALVAVGLCVMKLAGWWPA